MQILTDNLNRVTFYGKVSKGVFPEADPSRELYKIENPDGTFYAVTEGFFPYEVSELPGDYENFKYLYTPENGFELNPEFKPYMGSQEEQLEKLREENAMLTECILEMSEVLYS